MEKYTEDFKVILKLSLPLWLFCLLVFEDRPWQHCRFPYSLVQSEHRLEL